MRFPSSSAPSFAAEAPGEAGFAKAGRALVPTRFIHRNQTPHVIAIAHTPAATLRAATSANRCGCRAGATVSATMAGAVHRPGDHYGLSLWWPTPTARRSSWPRRCARNGCASTARRGRPRHREPRAAAVEVYIDEIEVLARPPNCRCRCSASRTTRGDPAEIPFPRPAPRASAQQHHAARQVIDRSAPV